VKKSTTRKMDRSVKSITARVDASSKTATSTRESSATVSSTERASSHGVTVPYTEVNSGRTKSLAPELTSGLMDLHTKARCLTAFDMVKVNISTLRKALSTRVTGSKVCATVKETSSTRTTRSMKARGKKE